MKRAHVLAGVLAFASASFATTAHADPDPASLSEQQPQPQSSQSRPPTVQPDEPAPAPPAVTPTYPVVVGGRVDGAWAPRELFKIPAKGADLGLAIGARPSDNGAFWGTSRVFIGSTEYGLKLWSVRVGGEGEIIFFDRIRAGLGLGLFLLGIKRAARDETIRTWGPELRASLRVDFARADGFALFARAAVDVAYEIYDGTTFWGPALGGGVDLDITTKRR